MTYKITNLEDGRIEIEISFLDEDIDLVGKTTIIGEENDAEKYLPFFEKDLRVNYSYLFPTPEPELILEEGDFI